ncbi:MAG: sigma-70 family RNA polymerase sigma factor [Acidobacteriia bacterium]|nr:sigma-70 family RNA polymerase sigma factor [Terriglobia bacterium]
MSAEESHDSQRVSDEELLATLQAGDLEALSMLFSRYARLILGIGIRILRDAGEAEDLVQDIFLRLFEKARTFDATKGSARTWIVQVAYRHACGRRAHLGRRGFYSGTNLDEVENALVQDIRLEEQLAARLTGEQLLGAFEQLNEKQRTTLRLYYFEGLELREIAQKLGETLENTRHYFYRGLEHLRKSAIALGLHGAKQGL